MSTRSGCAPLVVNFTNLSSGSGLSYSWSLGNGVFPTNASPSTSYTTPGKYPVILTVTNASGSSSFTDTVTVYAGPTVAFSANIRNGCSPLSTQFTSVVTANAPGPLSYSWAFGDGTTDTAANPLHIYQTAGSFNVSLTVTNGPQCPTTTLQSSYITALPRPQPSFSANQSYHCGAPATVNFAAASTGNGPFTYNWDFGDNSTGTGATPSHTYANGGSFTVRLIATDLRGCSDTVTIPNYIFVLGSSPSFTAPSTCEDSLLTFTNTTGTGGVAAWDFGDGTLDTGNTLYHTYNTPGIYTVRMTVLLGNCPKTVVQTIRSFPKSGSSITPLPAVPCPAPTTISLQANSSVPIQSYTWLWDGRPATTGATGTQTYTADGVYHVRLVSVTQDGCIDTLVYDDNILIRPIDQILSMVRSGDSLRELKGGCVPYTLTMGKILLTTTVPVSNILQFYPATVTSWNWDFGDGTVSTAPYPTHTYTGRGTYRIRSIIGTSNGCVDTSYSFISVDTPVRPSFRPLQDSVCFFTPVTYINTTQNAPPGLKYIWSSDREDERQDTSRFTVQTFDELRIQVMLSTDNKGCRDSFVYMPFVRVLPPISKFRDSTACYPSLDVKFTNMTIGATSQLWLFGDGTTDTARNVTHTYPAAGVYNVQLVSYNATSGCRDTGNKGPLRAAIRLTRPEYDFVAADTAVCVDRPVAVYADYPEGGNGNPFPASYAWFFDSSYVDFTALSATSWAFDTSGYHDVTLLLRYGRNSCIDTLRKTQYILAGKPVPHFSADIIQGCLPLVVTLRDSTTSTAGYPNAAWEWNFGDKDSIFSNLDTLQHIYTKPGSYDVKIIVYDSLSCKDSLLLPGYIKVHKTTAVITAAGPDGACAGTAVDFGSASTGFGTIRQRWDFGDGTTDTARNPRHVYASPGIFHVRLVAVDSIGCSDTARRLKPIAVSRPVAAFKVSQSTSVCPPLQVSFSNQSSSAGSYTWDFGDGSPGPVVVPNPITTFTQAGIFTVRLIAIDSIGCRDTAYDSVRVLGYNGAFSFTPATGCLPLEVSFSPAVANIPKLTWDFGDGYTDTSLNSATVRHSYTQSGAFLPKVIFSDGQGCNATSQALDSVYVDALRADFNWSLPCADTPFTLTSTATAIYGAPTTFTWTAPAATAPAQGSPARMRIPAAGTFPVTLVAANAAGCTDTITKDVPINALPPVSAGPDTAVCPGDTAHLFASGALSFVWAPAATNPTAPLSCTNCPAPLAWTRTPVVYTLSGVDANGCWGRDSVRVAIQLKTTSTTGPGGAVCYGESYRLNAAGADTYAWSPAQSLDSPGIAAPLATPTTTTTYMVISQEGSCQVDTQRIEVVVHARPDFSAGPDKIIALGAAATLEPRGSFAAIEWLYGDTTLSCLDCRNPNAHPSYTRTYWARAVSAQGCESIDSVTVHVRCNGSQVFIPNTFTPNGDGQNDWFYAQGAGLDRLATFRVFNRWGELVFEALNVPLNSATAGWDGTYKGQALPPDTYVYTMTSRCRSGETVSFKGDVSLVR